MWFETNTGISPSKEEIKEMLEINRWNYRDFILSFRFLIHKVFTEEAKKRYYVDTVPDIRYNIVEELNQAKNYHFSLKQNVEKPKAKIGKFIVPTR